MKIEPMSDYLADEAIGSSQMKMIMESPRDFLFQKKARKQESSAQAKGTLWHTYILERELYHSHHLIQPQDWGSLVENPGRKLWNDFKAKAKEAGKTPVKYKDASDLLLLDEVIDSHDELKKILATHKSEVSFYAELDGIKLKSREDLWCDESGTVWDVKTSSDILKREGDLDENIGRAIWQNKYHFSAAHHIITMKLAGYDVKEWGWIFVSTSTPCPHIILRKASKQMLDFAKDDWNYAFKMLKECKQKDQWVGYDDEISEIDLPEWAVKLNYM